MNHPVNAWFAPVDTGLDEPGWMPLGHITDDGVLYPEPGIPAKSILDRTVMFTIPPTVTEITWRWHRLLTGRPDPAVRRIKSEYHRRR